MRPPHLSVVRCAPPPPESRKEPLPPGIADRGETILVGSLFGLNLVPVIGELVHPGGWSPAIVAFAALAALLSGYELVSQVRARWRARTRGRGSRRCSGGGPSPGRPERAARAAARSPRT